MVEDPDRLPSGRHSLSRDYVRGNQEQRLIAAAGRALADRTYPELKVADITDGAKVSRATFYEIFDGKQACVLAAHEAACEHLMRRIGIACQGLENWDQRVAAGVREGLRFADEAPHEARLLLLHALGADAELSAQVLAGSQRLVEVMRASPNGPAVATRRQTLLEEALVAGITSIVAEHLISGDTKKLLELEPELTDLLLMRFVAPPDGAQPPSWPASKPPR